MAPLNNSIAHFMHPPHKLTELTADTSYHCDGCKILGTGPRFTCSICNFNLHKYCAKCPTKWLISTTNHPHQLSLFVNKPKHNKGQLCKRCHNPIEGLAYQCKGCKFMVHPLCVSSGSGTSQDGVNHSGLDLKRVDPQDVVELGQLATSTIYHESVVDNNGRISFATSDSTNVYEVPSSGSSSYDSSGGDDGGVFEAIIRGIGQMFQASFE